MQQLNNYDVTVRTKTSLFCVAAVELIFLSAPTGALYAIIDLQQ